MSQLPKLVSFYSKESVVAIGSTVAAVVEAVATADSMDIQLTGLPAAVAASTGIPSPATTAAREGKTLPDNLSQDLLEVSGSVPTT